MDRPKWLEARRRGIGGSDVAAIMGLSPFKTAFRVYQEKRKEVDDWGGNALTDWGSRMEPAIRQWYSDTTGRAVRLPDKIIFNEKYPYMLASLDGFTDDPRGVEIKTARSGRDWGEPGTDQIPDYYLVQVQHYMIVTGFPVFDVPVSIGGGAPELYEVPADKELQEMIIEAEARFWEQVQNGNPPDVTTYADAVARFGKNATSGAVIASAAAILDVVNLHQVREEMKALEEREEFLKGNLIIPFGRKGKRGEM
jgi:putative phage-type endonuclease